MSTSRLGVDRIRVDYHRSPTHVVVTLAPEVLGAIQAALRSRSDDPEYLAIADAIERAATAAVLDGDGAGTATIATKVCGKGPAPRN